jgi:hypothetical protein
MIKEVKDNGKSVFFCDLPIGQFFEHEGLILYRVPYQTGRRCDVFSPDSEYIANARAEWKASEGLFQSQWLEVEIVWNAETSLTRIPYQIGWKDHVLPVFKDGRPACIPMALFVSA